MLARALIMYYARARTAMGYTEIGAAFNVSHDSPVRHFSRFLERTELYDYEKKCLRDLDVIFSELDKVAGSMPVPAKEEAGLEWTVTVTLEPLAFQRLLLFHQTGMFGGTIAETTKMILSHRLYDMGEPNK
jgi:hypothetical protein